MDILPMLEAEAKERQRLSEGRGKKGSQKIDDLNAGRSDDQAATMAGTNRQYVSDARRCSERVYNSDMAKLRTNITITPEGRSMWRILARRSGLSASQYLEVLIRAEAELKGVTAEPPPKPTRSKPRKTKPR